VRLTEDQRLQDIAALGIVALVLAGVGILNLATRESTRAAPTPDIPTKVLGEHVERPPTSAADAPKPAAPVPSVPSSQAAPAPSKRPPTTHLVTVTSIVDCGPGGATADIALSTDKTGSTGTYVSDGTIAVTNSLRRPIQIDNLVVKVDFADGSSDTIRLADASGVTINTGGDNILHTSLNTEKQPAAAAIDTLDYHVAGEQRCTGRIR
jgi:hypothetical protein